MSKSEQTRRERTVVRFFLKFQVELAGNLITGRNGRWVVVAVPDADLSQPDAIIR